MSKNWNWDNIKNRISKFYVFKVAAVSPFIIPLSYWTVRKILRKHRIKYYYFYTDISDNGKSFVCLISKKKKRLIECRKELECRSKQFNMGLTIILAAQIFFYIKWIRDGRNILLGTTYISLTLIVISFKLVNILILCPHNRGLIKSLACRFINRSYFSSHFCS